MPSQAGAARARGGAATPWPPASPHARSCPPTRRRRPTAAFNLLTAKPVLYAANVAEDELAAGNRARRRAPRPRSTRDGETAEVVTFSAKVEAELAELAPEDRAEFLESLGLTESGLDRWPTRRTTCSACRATSPPARRKSGPGPSTGATRRRPRPGVIHSDFEKGFIRAETVAYDDFVRVGGWKPAREQGLARAEGKEYVVQDGDVMLFRFSS